MRDICYSRGMLAVIWRVETRFKLEVWSLNSKDSKSLKLEAWLHEVFSSLSVLNTLPVVDMVLEGEAKALVLWTQAPVSRVKCWAVFDVNAGKLLRKWEHDLDSDVGFLGRPLLRTNGKILLCVAAAGRSVGRRTQGPNFRKLALVYNIATGKEISRDAYEDYQFCRRHDKATCAVVDVHGNVYLALQGNSKKPFLEIFNPLDNVILRRRISLGTLFPPSKRGAHRDFYTMDLDPVGDSIYCTTYYHEQATPMVVRAFTKLPLRSLHMLNRPLRPPAPQVLQEGPSAFNYDPLTLGYWGYHSDLDYTEERFRLGLYEQNVPLSSFRAMQVGPQSVNTKTLPAYDRFQNTLLDNSDDGILVFRSRNLHKNYFFIMCLDENWRVPKEIGQSRTLDQLEMCVGDIPAHSDR